MIFPLADSPGEGRCEGDGYILRDLVGDKRPVETVVRVRGEGIVIVVRERHVAVDWPGDRDHLVPFVEGTLEMLDRRLMIRRIGARGGVLISDVASVW